MATDRTACPRCGAAVPPDARFCASCGYATARIVPGQTLDGKYEILDKIGEGGMGEVYRARHIHLDEIRIIKVTKPDALGEGAESRRFQQEARLATLVRHPNVAALYDFSRLPDGSYYMVWEFIDGITLEEWLRRSGPLPFTRALDVARQVLAGLSQIHAQGIVHRDLSPDNVMLRQTADGISAKIIDLGIAKRVEAESLRMTGTGMFVGKLKYCSPEQAGALAPGETVDARSDLYSFGVVLYEMLTGKAPFEAQTPEAYLGKHLHSPPPPLDTSRLPTSAAPELAGIVKRALEKSRERRFRDARDFQAALEKLQAYATEPASSAPTAVMAPRRSAGRRGILLASVLLLAAVGVGIALRGRTPRREAPSGAPPSPQPAVAEEGASPLATPDPQAEALNAAIDLPRSIPTPPPATAAPTLPPPPGPATGGGPVRVVPGVESPQEARAALDRWRKRGAEPRAHLASQIASLANRFVAAYPEDPLALEMRERLPLAFKQGAEAAWDNARPLMAAMYYRAYRQLSFAPPDPDLDRRAAEGRGAAPRNRRRRSPG